MSLNCNGLTKKYFTKTAVDHIDLNLEAGHIYALLGPNGSGKSTLMKMIAGLTTPTEGAITIDGQPISYKTKAEITYAPTEAFFFNYMTIGEAARYYADFFQDFDWSTFREILGYMDLREDMKVRSLSSGMMAKAKMTISMARRSKLILLDEPLNGIDLMARDAILKLMIHYAPQDGAIVISSHMVEELEQTIDHAIYMQNGHIVCDVDVEELRETEMKSVADKYREIYSGEVA